ncbi:MAG TPA: ATP-dependent Clp protease proteolytic subunit, partial [Acidimicrobiales bacterium]
MNDEPNRSPLPPLHVWRDGVDLWNEWARASLLERRTVLLDGPLDDATASRVTSELMLLAADGDEPIMLRIDSEGGSTAAALTVIDVIDALGVPVHAVCV